MKRVIFALVLMLLLMCGCESSEVCEEGKYWKVTKNTNGNNITYDYIIYDNEGNVILENESKTKPHITLDNDYYVCIYIENDSGYTVQYGSLYSDSTSRVYENPISWADGDVAIISTNEQGTPVISVRSGLGDRERCSYELPLSTDISPEDAILGAAFDEYAEHLTVIYISEDENKHCTAVLPINKLDWENNPIDRFYDKYTVETYGTPDLSAAIMCEKEIWKAEFDNAYQMLRGMANPKIDSIQSDINNAEKNFESYADAYANIKKIYEWSNGFEGSEWGDKILFGSGAQGGALEYEAELYRQATLDLYRMMDDRFESVDEAFIFDEEEYLQYLRYEMEFNVIDK